MKLFEAKQILKKNGFILEDRRGFDRYGHKLNRLKLSDIDDEIDDEIDDLTAAADPVDTTKVDTDIDDISNSETVKIITVDHIDKDNYKDYIGETIHVKGDVDLTDLRLTELPIRFNIVDGNFDCSWNKLTSLEGAPRKVGGGFWCPGNDLTSLEGAPREVGGDFSCGANKLTSLEGAPEKIGGDFWCYENKITNLKGAPREVVGYFYCFDNEVQFTEDEVRSYCNVKGNIEV